MTTYPRTGMQRILAGSDNPVLRVTLRDQDGEAAAPVGGVLSCTVTRADGTNLGARTATSVGAGDLTAQLTTAEAATLDVLAAVWTVDGVVRARSWHRTVGGFLFSIADASELGVTGVSNPAKYRARDEVTDLIEHWTGVSWTPTYDVETFVGYARRTHACRYRPLRALRSITVDGAAVELTDYDTSPDSGVIVGSTLLCGQVTVAVEHGFDAPPHDLREAAMQAWRYRLLSRKSNLGERVRSISDDQGTRTFSFAGNNHPTGIDDIDAVIMAHDMRDRW